MPGDMRSSRQEVGVDIREVMLRQCPDKSILLAYTRNQKLEDPLRIRLHIEHCRSCQQQCAEYERLNASLDVLASVQGNLSYREPLANYVFNVIQGGKRQRRKQQSNKVPAFSFRIASVPIAFLLTVGALIVITAVAVWALIHAGSGVRLQSINQLVNVPRSSTAAVSQNHPTPTPRSKPFPTGVSSPTSVADPTPGSAPYIQQCSTLDDVAHSRMRICGYNFTPGDRVALFVKMTGSAPKQRHWMVVNAQGDFQDSFIINNCKVPEAIFAWDLDKSVGTKVLENIPFAGCPVPTPSGSPGAVQH